MNKTVFTSNVSFQDAQGKAVRAGYRVIGYARNPNGQYVAFGRR